MHVFLIVIYGFIMSYKKYNDKFVVVINCLCAHWSVVFMFIYLVLRFATRGINIELKLICP